MTKLTKEQVNKRFAGRYVEILKTYDYSKGFYLYEVIRAYMTIHENTTLGEDVGTALEYTR
jgi:uncharacterized protein YutD